jgi:S1-C subfamily serine protease
MIEGKLGGTDTLGAGIIFGTGPDRLYIVTANHVVRRGSDEAKNLRVKLKWLPGESSMAQLLEHSDSNLDIAVLAVAGISQISITTNTVPFDLLGDAGSLKRGDPAHTIGYPSGRAWDMPVTADSVKTVSGEAIQFESPYLYPGNSGGGC